MSYFSNIQIWFLRKPDEEFGVREIARAIDISPSTASMKLKALEKEGFLKSRKERMLLLFSADKESELFRDMKIHYNIRCLKESGLINALDEHYLKPTIVLFGSASNGYDRSDSDVDLVVISGIKGEFTALTEYERKLQRKIDLFDVTDVNELRNPHLINNVLNGIDLQGHIKWISKNAEKED